MKVKTFHEVYDDEKFCCDTIEWSHFDRCQFLNMDNGHSRPSCDLLQKGLGLHYTPSADPDIEGHKVLKHSICKASITSNDDQSDKLFITEILNDLERNGFIRGGKAETMLRDWSRELKNRSRIWHPATNLRRIFNKLIGKENW